MQIFTLYFIWFPPDWTKPPFMYFQALESKDGFLFFSAPPQTACASVWIRIKWAPCEKDDKIFTIAFPQNKPIVISSGLTVLVVIENEKHPLPVLLRSALKCAGARQLKCYPSSSVWARRGYSLRRLNNNSSSIQTCWTRESSIELQKIILKFWKHQRRPYHHNLPPGVSSTPTNPILPCSIQPSSIQFRSKLIPQRPTGQ